MGFFSSVVAAARGLLGQVPALVPAEPEPDLLNTLLGRIRDGDPAAQQLALAELAERAAARDTPEEWNGLAFALFELGRLDEAIVVWNRLIEHAPDLDSIRLNLATALSQVGQASLCRHHLTHLAEHGGTEEMCQLGREQLAGYEQAVGLTTADADLRALQFAALQEMIDAPDCPADAFLTFAKLLRHAQTLEPGAGWADESRSVLEAGATRHPGDVAILELLVAAYLARGPDDKLAGALRRLERLAPNSAVFDIIAGVRSADKERWAGDMSARVQDLVGKVSEGGPGERAAALSDLLHIVETYPQNRDYRQGYAFALLIVGDRLEALRQAQVLDEANDDSHSFHFNLGQIFYGCGDAARGRVHLDLAIAYAVDEGERLDARERIANLERR